MEFDVVIVGAGPSGLAAAIRLKQLNADLSIVVVEKGSEVGAHILSGAVIDPVSLDKLVPDWREDADCPLKTQVKDDHFYWMTAGSAIRLPNYLMPPLMNNHHCYIGSLGNVCRWLAREGRSARRRDLSGLCRDRSALRRQGRGARHRHRRHGHRQGRLAQGFLHARHGTARQIHAVRRRRARQPDQAADREILARRQQRAAEIRHRPQGSLADRSGQAPEGPDPAFVRLAARTIRPAAARSSITTTTTWSRSASSCISITTIRICRRSTNSSASRPIPRSARCSKAASGSPMARAPSPRAAISRCRG